jgi:hypothetical protein
MRCVRRGEVGCVGGVGRGQNIWIWVIRIFGWEITELVVGGQRGAAGAVVPPGLSLGAALHTELRTCHTERRQPSPLTHLQTSPPRHTCFTPARLERIETTPDTTDGSLTRGRLTPVDFTLKQRCEWKKASPSASGARQETHGFPVGILEPHPVQNAAPGLQGRWHDGQACMSEIDVADLGELVARPSTFSGFEQT